MRTWEIGATLPRKADASLGSCPQVLPLSGAVAAMSLDNKEASDVLECEG